MVDSEDTPTPPGPPEFSPPPPPGPPTTSFRTRGLNRIKAAWSSIKNRFSSIRSDLKGVNFRDSSELRERLRGQFEKFKQAEWIRKLPENLRDLDPQAIADFISEKFQQQKVGSYGKALVIILSGYFLADLSALIIGEFIPLPPASKISSNSFSRNRPRIKSIEDYEIIFSRNLFNSRGIIPGEQPLPGQGLDLPPVRTSLPFNLVGTLVLADELKSIASIEDKSASQVYPVRVEDEIPSKAKIVKIESNRVIFMNTQSGRKEFIDMPEENLRGPEISIRPSAKSQNAGIDRVSPTSFNIAKAEVEKALADPVTLTQARCIPALENGMSVGFRCFQIVPGSIYEKIGLQNNDIITTLNGQTMTDPSTAVQTLMELRGANHIEIAVKRNGKPMVFNYDIR